MQDEKTESELTNEAVQRQMEQDQMLEQEAEQTQELEAQQQEAQQEQDAEAAAGSAEWFEQLREQHDAGMELLDSENEQELGD